jgi:DNA-binding Lrp family transcriptional regulator
LKKEGDFVKTLSQTVPISLNFSMIPRSISERLRQLAGKTAGELLRLLCELTIGFRQSTVERSYRQLAQLLGKSVATIARAVKLLLRSGDVVVESRLGRSYRWSVLLEASDVRSDPAGICKIRAAQAEAPAKVVEEPPVEESPVAQEAPAERAVTAPALDEETAESASSVATAETRALLKRLINIGMRRRVAKELLAQDDHAVISAALDRVKNRSDIKNKAGYVLREVREGGYEDERLAANDSDEKANGATPVSRYSSVERTRQEQEELAAESAAKQQSFERAVKALEARCTGLSEGVRAHLRECCQRYLGQMMPQTSRKELDGPAAKAFKRVAFREVMERFFGFVDQGLAEEEALGRLGMGCQP